MERYEVSWIQSPEIRPQDTDKACKQVYVWILTRDKYAVIVSKDGKQWQLPGGKPEQGETLTETAVREVREETSLDISTLADSLRFVGYQTVKDRESDEPPYLQVRYLLDLDVEAPDLQMGVQGEDIEQAEKDIIRYVGAVSLDEIVQRIPWLGDASEFDTIKSLVTA